jgi:hypothetical protein
MELFLNAIWLALSLATLGGWLGLRFFSCADRRFLRGLVVLGCTLVLLFPVISMTDDLCAQQVATEDASRTSKKAFEAGESQSQKSLVAIIFPLASVQNPLWQALGFVSSEDRISVASIHLTPTSGRSPPSFV